MKTPAEVAAHPKARLHQQLVGMLRTTGSIEGAERAWDRMQSNSRLWKRITHFGLNSPKRQDQISKVAFPDCNFAEVDAALRAGNKLQGLYDLACGHAWLAKDSNDNFKIGRKGLIIVSAVRRTSTN